MKKENFADKAHIYELPYILTFNQVMEFLHIGRNSLLKYIHGGSLPASMLGGRWKIRRSDLEAFIESQFWS